MRSKVSATGFGFAAAMLFWAMTAAPCAARTVDRDALSHHASWARFAKPVRATCTTVDAALRELMKYNVCGDALSVGQIKHHAAPARSLFTSIPTAFTRSAQPRMCESPMRSLAPNIEMYAGLGCYDDTLGTTALDGFARLPYHLTLRQ